MKTAILRARIDPDLKIRVEKTLDELGMSTSDAIRIFFKQIDLQQGLPFIVKIPNKETEETFKLTDNKQNLVHCENVEDMFRKLDEDVEFEIYK